MSGVFIDIIDEHGDLFISHSVVFKLAAQLGTALIKSVSNVLEEDDSEDDVFVLGSIHRATELVGGFPKSIFELFGG